MLCFGAGDLLGTRQSQSQSWQRMTWEAAGTGGLCLVFGAEGMRTETYWRSTWS